MALQDQCRPALQKSQRQLVFAESNIKALKIKCWFCVIASLSSGKLTQPRQPFVVVQLNSTPTSCWYTSIKWFNYLKYWGWIPFLYSVDNISCVSPHCALFTQCRQLHLLNTAKTIQCFGQNIRETLMLQTWQS